MSIIRPLYRERKFVKVNFSRQQLTPMICMMLYYRKIALRFGNAGAPSLNHGICALRLMVAQPRRSLQKDFANTFITPTHLITYRKQMN